MKPFVIALGLGALLASVSPSYANVASQLTLKEKIGELDKQLETLSVDIKKTSRMVHQISQGSSSPSYIWENASGVPEKREALLRLLRSELRNRVEDYEQKLTQKENLESEFNWIEQSAGIEEKIKHSALLKKNAKSPSFCAVYPVEIESSNEPVQLVQDFGSEKDLSSGLAWASTGWWLSVATKGSVAKVKNCAKGVVAFAGPIKGRGFAILVDHGGGFMTLYANLVESAQYSEGMAIPAGAVLSAMPEKVYFEVRQGGQVTNPRQVFSAELLSNQGIKTF